MAAAGSGSLSIHDARHTHASLMIAAGVNPKALSEFMGHGSIAITFDLYGHMLPGAHREAAGLFDAFLARQLGGGNIHLVAASPRQGIQARPWQERRGLYPIYRTQERIDMHAGKVTALRDELLDGNRILGLR